jgi:hypothetical protein
MKYTVGFTGALVALAALAALAAVGCGGAAIPHDQLASSQAAVRAAEEVGAKNLPQAELHLKYAKDQIDRAKVLIADDENEEAKRVLLRAQADAELAIALAKEHAVRTEAYQAMQQVEALRQRAQ